MQKRWSLSVPMEGFALPELTEVAREAERLGYTDAWSFEVDGIDAFTRALRADPDHAGAHRNLAVALDRQGRSAVAVPHYQAFLRLARADAPGRPDVERRLTEVSASKSEP